MKLTKTIMVLGALVLAGQAPLALAQKCNDEKQVCHDKSGPNVELTRQRYGDAAAQKLERREARKNEGAGGGQAGGGGGRAGGGQAGGGGVGGGGGGGQAGGGGGQAGGGGGRAGGGQNAGGQAGGGQAGGGQAGGGQGDTFSPAAGISCIRSAQVCYSGGMPHPFYTAKYFGAGAASRISQ